MSEPQALVNQSPCDGFTGYRPGRCGRSVGRRNRKGLGVVVHDSGGGSGGEIGRSGGCAWRIGAVDLAVNSAVMDTKPHLGEDEAIIRLSFGIGDHLCHQHVLLITPPDEDLIQQVPVYRPGRLWECVGAADDGELVSPERQAEADQAIIDALRQTEQTSHDLVPDGKGDSSVASLCLWAAAPEEGVAGTHIIQLTLLRDSGHAKSSNVHLAVKKLLSG
ncbi:unnamed protein product [Schistocephalus solidus]|uniref:Nudix hydrolase domain-containing protein n=1 Tax=Schistocephalus solidus TaxID=70667 RepID=A0A183SFM7_SCHSO|nr:unnamed protein product [Schistocephalus solidus]